VKGNEGCPQPAFLQLEGATPCSFREYAKGATILERFGRLIKCSSINCATLDRETAKTAHKESMKGRVEVLLLGHKGYFTRYGNAKERDIKPTEMVRDYNEGSLWQAGIFVSNVVVTQN
jgi:hypothetical protein